MWISGKNVWRISPIKDNEIRLISPKLANDFMHRQLQVHVLVFSLKRIVGLLYDFFGRSTALQQKHLMLFIFLIKNIYPLPNYVVYH